MAGNLPLSSDLIRRNSDLCQFSFVEKVDVESHKKNAGLPDFINLHIPKLHIPFGGNV
jgi:hypothetical protein